MIFAKIAGTGSYLPEKIITNADLEKVLETSDQWIRERTGIISRRIAANDESSTTMAKIAAEQALQAANLAKDDIDMIIFATCTPDYFFPSCACILQDLLKIKLPIPAFDISAACAGFIFALTTAEQYIKNGMVKTILVVGSEVMSRVINWNDRSTCVIFGDGAGALILTASDEPGMMVSRLHSDGRHKDMLPLPNMLLTPEATHATAKFTMTRGSEVFKIAVNSLGDIVDEVLTIAKLPKSEVNWLVPHQANMRIIEATAKKLNMKMDKVILTIAEQGNTSGASIPLALDNGIRTGKITRGDILLLEGFGGGLSWGASLIKY